MKILTTALVVCLATALPAEAQIYTWRDDSGRLVLSNRPQAGSAAVPTYAVPGPSLIRTTTEPRELGRGNRYDDLIRQAAERHRVSPDLIRAVIQAESAFDPYAVSLKGAMGLMQLMPATARELGVSDPFHPADNIRGGVTYLARLLARYEQNVELALAAYNAGPGNVERYGAVPPFHETRSYVKKITGATQQSALPVSVAPAIYKWLEVVDGKPSIRYSNVPPRDVTYEVVGKR